MAESGLSLGYADLKTDAACLLGWARSAGARTTNQNNDLDRIIKAGLRMFYNARHWHFKKVNYASISTVASDDEYDLPDDFGGVIGDAITISEDGESYDPILVVPHSHILELRQQDHDSTGCPTRASVNVKAFTGVTSCRFQLEVWPLPNAVYDLVVPYKPFGEALSDSAPYPWGIAAVSEGIRAACRAQADLMIRDLSGGPNWEYYMNVALPGAILADNDLAPRRFGKVLDTSDGTDVDLKITVVTSAVTPS